MMYNIGISMIIAGVVLAIIYAAWLYTDYNEREFERMKYAKRKYTEQEKSCQMCGNEFIAKGATKYCCEECRTEARKRANKDAKERRKMRERTYGKRMQRKKVKMPKIDELNPDELLHYGKVVGKYYITAEKRDKA